ncbi:ATP-dependent DNA helicase RecQ-like isoform X1 [Crassostrea virginica]
MASRSTVAAAFERVKDKFEVKRLKDEQLDILTAIMRGDDCVGVLPTGYGKSLPYQVSKMVANELGIEFHKVVVCSPLISLMQDQVARLQSFGHIMKVMYVKGQEDFHSVEDCDVIFSSPENLVGNESLKNSLARLKVSLLVVDEFHTVSTW